MSTFSDLMLSRVPVNSPVHMLVHQELVLCFPCRGAKTQTNTTRVVRATAMGLGWGQDGVRGWVSLLPTELMSLHGAQTPSATRRNLGSQGS